MHDHHATQHSSRGGHQEYPACRAAPRLPAALHLENFPFLHFNGSLLQGIFPTQGSNPDLLHHKQILPRLVVESVCVCLQYREVWLQEGAVQEAGSDGVAES